jgi:competence protein ComGC
MHRKRILAGFVFLEALIAVAILNILAVRSATQYLQAFNNSQTKGCLFNRSQVERLNQLYSADHGKNIASLEDLRADKYYENVPACPKRGAYVWQASTGSHNSFLMCSVHGWTRPNDVVITTTSSSVLFKSNMDSLDGFTTLEGEWAIDNGFLVPVGKGKDTVLFGDTNWADYAAKLNFTLLDGNSFGLFYRTNGAAKITGYYLEYNVSGKLDLAVHKVEDGKKKGGDLDKATLPKGFPAKNLSHEITVKLKGSSHKIYLDGELILDFTDDSYGSGALALEAPKGTEVALDSAFVEKQ